MPKIRFSNLPRGVWRHLLDRVQEREISLADLGRLHEQAQGKEVAAMKSYIFRVTAEEDVLENGQQAYHASCPALKGCHTWRHTYPEALANIKEAIELYIEDLREAVAVNV